MGLLVRVGLGGLVGLFADPAEEPPVAVSGDARDHPVPVGDPAVLDETWRVRVASFRADATEDLALVTVEVAHSGDDEASALGAELAFHAVDAAGRSYEARSCAGTSTALDLGAEVQSGETATGAICFAAPADARDSLVLVVETGSGDRRLFLALA